MNQFNVVTAFYSKRSVCVCCGVNTLTGRGEWQAALMVWDGPAGEGVFILATWEQITINEDFNDIMNFIQ